MFTRPALEIDNLNIRFGAVHAVRGVTFSLAPRSSTALVGPNGAGKSSIFLALAHALPSSAQVEGSLRLNETPNAGGSDKKSNMVSVVPERDKIFTLLTVEENLKAADRERDHGRIRREDVFNWFPRLSERRGTLAGNLSGGEQQMLAIAMALFGSPALLAIDEPTLGLSVPMIEQTCEILAMLRRQLNLTLLIAEADVLWLDKFADQAIVLNRGAVLAHIKDNLGANREYIRNLLLGIASIDVNGIQQNG